MEDQNKLLEQMSATSDKISKLKVKKTIDIKTSKKHNGKLIMDEHIQTGKVTWSFKKSQIEIYYK
jgi:hypothetical protein